MGSHEDVHDDLKHPKSGVTGAPYVVRPVRPRSYLDFEK